MSPLERDAQLLEVGMQCSDSTCLLVDFLPFKCVHCGQPFCADHFLPDAHHCEKYDATKYDRVAPSCPLCNTPVAIPPGEDPNIRMDRHIRSECLVVNGSDKVKTKTSPTCRSCGKVLFLPIQCDSCQEQFCPHHRFPKDHSCSGSASTSKSKGALLKSMTDAANRAGAVSAAGRAAIARSTAATAAGARTASQSSTLTGSKNPNASKATLAQTEVSTSSSTASGPGSNPFSATHRRAKEEAKSRKKAIEDRARKGIAPSEEEKAFLAGLEASSKDNCLVM